MLQLWFLFCWRNHIFLSHLCLIFQQVQRVHLVRTDVIMVCVLAVVLYFDVASGRQCLSVQSYLFLVQHCFGSITRQAVSSTADSNFGHGRRPTLVSLTVLWLYRVTYRKFCSGACVLPRFCCSRVWQCGRQKALGCTSRRWQASCSQVL